MPSPMNWLEQTFSSETSEDDLVKSRSLNTTRMAAVVAPILAGIWTGVSEVVDKPPFNHVGFQRQLVLAFIGLIALVSVADIIARAIASSKAQVPVATLFPSPVSATKDVSGGPDLAGSVVAFRSVNARNGASLSEFLFVSEDGTASWETDAGITLS